MSEACKETCCTSCIHRPVCSLEKEFLTIREELDDVQYIKPVKLECRYYAVEYTPYFEKRTPNLEEGVIR